VTLTVVFALAAALANATHLLTQHVASADVPKRAGGRRLVTYLFSNPLWLFGWAAAGAAFLFQAIALHHGLLSIVQPLLVAELVFTLALRRYALHQDIAPAAWVSATFLCVALAVFVTAAEPTGGTPTPDSRHWIACLAAFGAVVALCTLFASRGSPTRRAALYATAAAIVFAFMATFLKAATQTLTSAGPGQMLAAWPVYGIVICGVGGSVLQQAALQSGPLSISQPLFTSVDPAVAIVVSLWIFGERYTNSPTKVIAGIVSFIAMVIGVVMLCRAAPPTIAPSPHHATTTAPPDPAAPGH
jgi:drug/metabolite transporter (DMT)-like permease